MAIQVEDLVLCEIAADVFLALEGECGVGKHPYLSRLMVCFRSSGCKVLSPGERARRLFAE